MIILGQGDIRNKLVEDLGLEKGIKSFYHRKTAGRGHKGMKARSGGVVSARFEGGQTPIQRRLPKYGQGKGRYRIVK